MTVGRSAILGGLVGAGIGVICLAGLMCLYMIGGLSGALTSVDPPGTIPSAVATPLFYFLVFLVPVALIGAALGSGLATLVAVLARRSAVS